MKYYNYLSKIFLFLSATWLLAGSCSQTESVSMSSQNMKIKVYDCGIKNNDHSRVTTGENYMTQFEQGDCIGLFAIKNGGVWNNINNVKVTFADNGTWTTEQSLRYDNEQEGVLYYAYFPYKENLNLNDNTSIEDFFKTMVNEWIPASDQSDADKYASADLLTSDEGSAVIQSADGQFVINLTMKHRMALSVINIPEIEYVFSNASLNETPYIVKESTSVFYKTSEDAANKVQPYLAEDGTYRLIVQPSGDTSIIVTQGEEAEKKYEFKMEVGEGEYQHFLLGGGKKTVNHELKIGDFYCADGSIVAGDNENIPDNCIGIVFYVGNPQPSYLYPDAVNTDGSIFVTDATDALKRDYPSCVHGLVYALEYANEAISVLGDGNRFNLPGEPNFGYLCKAGNKEPHYTAILGYNNTEVMKLANKASLEQNRDWNFSQLITYLEDYSQKHTLPSGITTDWYLPSIEEMRILINNEMTLNASLSKVGGNELWYLNGTENSPEINPRDRFKGYWSSSLRSENLFYFVNSEGEEGNDINGNVWHLGYFRFAFAF